MEYKECKKIDSLIYSSLLEREDYDNEMVVSTGRYTLSELPCVVAIKNNNVFGLLTYQIYDDYLEIISIDSFLENKGIGSELLKKIETIALDLNKKMIKVITTNENIKALYFYQKNKYRIIEIIANAVIEARKIKPTIPLIGENGIEIKDEIILIKKL
uniref:Acetyltransferase GNAT family protein n=1 Tax=Mammaliicoccus stepanovicii TaxID=643214 RepID=A0A0K2JNF5_9STAP|nr:acetyltransferase GNAT family protein [Mammaliicoccus stepanovicii]